MSHRVFNFCLVLLFAAACSLSFNTLSAAETQAAATKSSPSLLALETRAAAGDSEAQMELARTLLARLGAGRDVDRAAYLLRSVAMGLSEHSLNAMLLLGELQEEVLREYPEIEVDALDSRPSVGVAMYLSKDKRWVEVIVREASLLNARAQSALSVIRKVSTGDSEGLDKRILEYFGEMADERIPWAMNEYGEMLLFGVNVEQDVESGTRLLEESGIPEAWLSLAYYAEDIGDKDLYEQHMLKAAKFDLPDATYNLGVSAQQRGEYKRAVSFFERTLDIKPDEHPARLELARMYVSGWGVEADEDKGFKLMSQVLEEAEGKARMIALMNIGVFYLQGIGVEQDHDAGIALLERAQEEGAPQAAALIEHFAPTKTATAN